MVLQPAVEPLGVHVNPQLRSALACAGEEVEHSPHTCYDFGRLQFGYVLVDPLLLLGCRHAEPQHVGLKLLYVVYHLAVFCFCEGVGKRGSVGADVHRGVFFPNALADKLQGGVAAAEVVGLAVQCCQLVQQVGVQVVACQFDYLYVPVLLQ